MEIDGRHLTPELKDLLKSSPGIKILHKQSSAKVRRYRQQAYSDLMASLQAQEMKILCIEQELFSSAARKVVLLD